MKLQKVECIIRPHKLDEVKSALDSLGVHGMTISEVRGAGRQKGHSEHYRGSEYTIDFLPKIKLEVVVQEDLVIQLTETVARAAKTGKFGDGKIFIYPVERVVRIRTGEAGVLAL